MRNCSLCDIELTLISRWNLLNLHMLNKQQGAYFSTDIIKTREAFNPLTPDDDYNGRTAPLTSKVAFYIFIQQI